MDINKESMLKKILRIELDQITKSKYIDLFTSEQAPAKQINNLLKDKNIRMFLSRDKKYYKFLEKEFSKLKHIELFKTFLYEIKIRYLQLERNLSRFNMIIKSNDKHIKSLVKIAENKYFYFKEFNPYLYNMFFFHNDNEYLIFNQRIQVSYIPFFKGIIEEEIKFLEKYKSYLNGSLKKNIKAIFEERLKKEKETTRKKIIFYFNIESFSKKELLDFIENLIELLDKILDLDYISNMRIFKERLKEILGDNEQILNSFINFFADNIGTYNLVTFGEKLYPREDKFFIEIDFSIPEDIFIENIKEIYKKYKKGEIQTFKEFLKDEKIPKYEKIKNLNEEYIFKIKDEKNIPLYVKLVDLIYIYDTYLLNLKQTLVVKEIENNRLNYDDSFKSFTSTYKIYKKFITDFVKEKKYNYYI